jgi:hypothetical protein
VIGNRSGGTFCPGRSTGCLGHYLNRLSSVCGAWFASDSACVPSC